MSSPDYITSRYFVRGSRESDWYSNLTHRGSCLELLRLLRENPLRLKETGEGNVTVLDKAVRHGCDELVKLVIDMFDDSGKSLHDDIDFTLKELLSKTNDNKVTAVTIAALIGSPKVVRLLKKALDVCEAHKARVKASKIGYRDHFSGIYDVEMTGETTVAQANNSSSDVPAVQQLARDQTKSGVGHDIVDQSDIIDSCDTKSVSNDIEKSNDDSTRSVQSELAREFSGVCQICDVGRGQPVELIRATSSTCLSSTSDITGSPRDRGEEMPADEGIPLSNTSKSLEAEERCCHTPDVGIPNPRLEAPVDNPIHVVWENMKEILELPDPAIQKLKLQCKKDVNYDFVPNIEEIFFHFFIMSNFSLTEWKLLQDIFKSRIHKWEPALVIALFNHQDPQGRTPLHVAANSNHYFNSVFKDVLQWIPEGEEYKECLNARDGAGRTPLHRACIEGDWVPVEALLKDGRTDCNARICPANYDELSTLLNWRSPHVYKEEYDEDSHCTALHLAVLHDNSYCVDLLLEHGSNLDVNAQVHRYSHKCKDCPGGSRISAFAMAGAMGHIRPLERLLKDKREFDSGKVGSPKSDFCGDPALHVAASRGRVEAMLKILNCKDYDPLCLSMYFGKTALHVAVYLKFDRHDMLVLQDLLPYGYLGDLKRCLHRKKEESPIGYSGNAIACINLLLQAGIDIWSTDEDGNTPNLGLWASSEATKWWYDKVTNEVVDFRKNVNDAANAISVIAPLVATASFIGPLQPPLGYETLDGYVHLGMLPIRIYMLCSGLSFYLAVASIMLAVIPALPMPKESMQDELQRSQRSLKVVAGLLLLSIIYLLLSFASASIAVVPTNWKNREYVVMTIVCGGGACIFVLALFSLRLVRQLFHRSLIVRRLYAKYVKL